MFYICLKDIEEREKLIALLKQNGFHAVFHYISLHSSAYYNDKHDGRALINADNFTNTLLRLPMFYELDNAAITTIVQLIQKFHD